jgi:hypothetical protein
VTFDRIVATATLDTIVAFVIPSLALLTSSPVMLRKEHLWDSSVLQRIHLSDFVILPSDCSQGNALYIDRRGLHIMLLYFLPFKICKFVLSPL